MDFLDNPDVLFHDRFDSPLSFNQNPDYKHYGSTRRAFDRIHHQSPQKCILRLRNKQSASKPDILASTQKLPSITDLSLTKRSSVPRLRSLKERPEPATLLQTSRDERLKENIELGGDELPTFSMGSYDEFGQRRPSIQKRMNRLTQKIMQKMREKGITLKPRPKKHSSDKDGEIGNLTAEKLSKISKAQDFRKDALWLMDQSQIAVMNTMLNKTNDGSDLRTDTRTIGHKSRLYERAQKTPHTQDLSGLHRIARGQTGLEKSHEKRRQAAKEYYRHLKSIGNQSLTQMNIFALRNQFDQQLKDQVWKPAGPQITRKNEPLLTDRSAFQPTPHTARRSSPPKEKRSKSTHRSEERIRGASLHNKWYIPKKQWFKDKPTVNITKLLNHFHRRQGQEEDEPKEEGAQLNFYEQLNKGTHQIPYYKLKRGFDELDRSGKGDQRKGAKEVAMVAKLFKQKIDSQKGRVPHYIDSL